MNRKRKILYDNGRKSIDKPLIVSWNDEANENRLACKLYYLSCRSRIPADVVEFVSKSLAGHVRCAKWPSFALLSTRVGMKNTRIYVCSRYLFLWKSKIPKDQNQGAFWWRRKIWLLVKLYLKNIPLYVDQETILKRLTKYPLVWAVVREWSGRKAILRVGTACAASAGGQFAAKNVSV